MNRLVVPGILLALSVLPTSVKASPWDSLVFKADAEIGLGSLLQAQLSPDAACLATMGESCLYVWHLNGTLESVFRTPTGLPFTSFGWSPDASMIAASDSAGLVHILKASSASLLATLDYDLWDNPISSSAKMPWRPLVWSPNGSLIALGWRKGQVHILNLHLNRPLTHIVLGQESGEDIESIDWSPQGTVLYSITGPTFSNAGSTWVYNLSTRERLHYLDGGIARFSPDGERIAAYLSRDVWDLRIYDSQKGTRLIRRSAPGVTQLVWSPDSKRIALGTNNGTVLILDSSSGAVLSETKVHDSSVTSISWRGNYMATAPGGSDVCVKIWTLTPTGELLLAGTFSGWRGREKRGKAVSWLPEGQDILVFGSHMEPLTVYSQEGEEKLSIQLAELHGSVVSAAVSPDGRMIAAVVGTPVMIWDARFGGLANRLETGLEVYDMAWNPVSPGILALSGLGGVEVWDITGCKPISRIIVDDICRGMAWSPQGDLVAVGLRSKVQVWNVERSLLLAEKGTWSRVYCVAWSRDGSRLACMAGYSPGLDVPPKGCSLFEMAKVYAWEVARVGDAVQLLPAGEVVVACTWREPMSRCLAWSPNSTMLVAAGGSDEVIWTRGEVERCGMVAEQAALVWRFEGGEMRPVGRLVGPARPITSVSWSPDGARIAGGSLDGQIRLWFVGSSAQIGEMFPMPALLALLGCPHVLVVLRHHARKAPSPGNGGA